MSIYQRRGWDNVSDINPHVAPGKVAAPEHGPSSAVSAELQDWSKVRKAKPAEHLLPLSEKFLDHLPPEVFPSALATYYARIVNLIALQWDDRSSCERYFKELLTDQRGGRQGFPATVKRDLVNLRAYRQRSGPQLEA
jgi:hypothetical protein